MSKKSTLDQYYTKQEVVDYCWSIIDNLVGDCTKYVEPSAGTGNWLREDKSIIGYDLDPKRKGIMKQDWLLFDADLSGYCVVGNPPFGFASSLAVKFINKSFDLGAEYVCFVLPRTFMKELFVDKNLTTVAELIFEEELPKESFILDDQPYDVPCVFQVYKRGIRTKVVYKDYLTKGSSLDYDFILRRVGGRSGKVLTLEEYTESSSLFVKGDIEWVYKLAQEIGNLSKKTAGVRSITLSEINYLITKSLN